jgi:hypothetical protein
MFKIADTNDLPACLEIAKKFIAFYGLTYHEPSVQAMLTHVLNNGVFLLAVNKGVIQGGAGAVITNNPWNHTEVIYQEMFWWVEEEYRNTSVGIKLLLELEKCAPTNSKIVMSILPHSNFKHSTMEKLGYSLKELAYIKE